MESERKKNIIIIGAGAAGIACGKKLSENGSSEFEILYLEGRDRVSGRCWTRYFGGEKKYPVDLGACWIEGLGTRKNPNPIRKLADEHSFYYGYGHGGHSVYDYDGNELDPSLLRKVGGKYYTTYKLAKKEGRSLPPDTEDTDLESMIKKKESELGIEYTPVEHRIKNYVESGTEQFNGGTMKEFSAKNFGKGPDFKGGEAYVQKGIGRLLEKEFERLQLPIHFNTVVKNVNYEDPEKVFVVCQSKEEEKVYEADYVICTVPLGVLKEKYESFFTPALPRKKVDGIKNIGFGLMNKLVLVFEEKFWSDMNNGGFGYVCETTKGRWRFWNSVSQYYTPEDDDNNKCAILVSLMTCEFAKSLERNMSEEQIVEDAMKVIRKIFSSKKIPEPIETCVSFWNNDEMSRGGYSFLGTHSSLRSCAELAKEVNRLHFAGEHTSQFYSAIHGAWISGEREAIKILKKEGIEIKNEEEDENVGYSSSSSSSSSSSEEESEGEDD